jgi:hypothetical protein
MMRQKISVIRHTENEINVVITLEQCKTILNQGQRKFNDREIKEIREYLYFIGQLELETNGLLN